MKAVYSFPEQLTWSSQRNRVVDENICVDSEVVDQQFQLNIDDSAENDKRTVDYHHHSYNLLPESNSTNLHKFHIIHQNQATVALNLFKARH